MGRMKHDSIIVTSWGEDHITKAAKKAIKLGLAVSELVPSNINGYSSFLIAPDGSKEGWDESEAGIKARSAWKVWADKEEDLYIEWVHLTWGGDNPERCAILDRSYA